MADTEQQQSFFQKLTSKQKVAAGLGGLALVFALALSGVYSGSTEYKVLFSNVADRDGGAIVAALDTMHVPYKFSDGGGAILVPSEFVHEARLKLAGQGLPKGGNVGFELMENQKFGISHFAEHINYQRALEGELVRTISSIQYVSGARVHLSIPKQTVFVKDTLQPSASVFLNVMQGRSLDKSQIVGIANLVSAAVPSLKPSQVTIVDQSGANLHGGDEPSDGILDGRQITAQRKIEGDYSREIEAILEPVVGRGNVRAKVRVELDLGKVEQTEEIYGPNGDALKASVRSTQSMESSSGSNAVGGVPGAVSNTPPGAVSAPDQVTGAKPNLPPLPSFATNGNKSSTTNYEVDRTVRHTKKATGTVNRLSVAVLLNNKSVVGADGKAVSTPLTSDELSRATKLVQDVVGYKADRGDSVEVANIEFVPNRVDPIPDTPIWQDPEMQSLAAGVGKGLGLLVAVLYLLFGVARPMMKKVLADEPPQVGAATLAEGASEEAGAAASISEAALAMAKQPVNELDASKRKAAEIAGNAPDAAASVVKKWVESEGA